MFSRNFLAQAAVVLTVVSWPALCSAQLTYDAFSGSQGAARGALDQIVQQDVGRGYSGDSLNLIALQNARAQVPYVGQQSTPRGGPSFTPSISGRRTNKPFSTFSPDPTVSPYLNLFREDFDGNSDLNYPTLVRPMLQQQSLNQQVQRQAMELERQIQSVAAQSDFNPQGSQDLLPTGHQTAFRYYGHFYPTMSRPRGR